MKSSAPDPSGGGPEAAVELVPTEAPESSPPTPMGAEGAGATPGELKVLEDTCVRVGLTGGRLAGRAQARMTEPNDDNEKSGKYPRRYIRPAFNNGTDQRNSAGPQVHNNND